MISAKPFEHQPHRLDVPTYIHSTKPTDYRVLLSPESPKGWPPRPSEFPDLLRPVEAAQYLRLDELGNHTPETAVRTLNFWRDRGQLRATKFARHVWYRKGELDRFLAVKTES